MGNLTEICNQTTNVQNPLHATEQTEEGHFTALEVSQSPQQLQEEINELRQQEDFGEFCANKVLKKHNEREEYYLGQWAAGYRKGRALMFRPTEYLYFGDVDRIPQGRGKLKLYRQNILIDGEMRSGKPQGQCNIRDLNGVYTFEGLISSQQLPTSGRFQVSNPTDPQKCYAIMLDQYPANKATIEFRDGGRYVGEISFDSLMQQGEGEERYVNNAVYVGGWNNGQYHGKGKFSWPDGSSYDGDYLNGIKEGHGVYVYASKKVYKGEWVNGKQEGRGLLLSCEGKTLKRGIWSQGSYVRGEEEVEQ